MNEFARYVFGHEIVRVPSPRAIDRLGISIADVAGVGIAMDSFVVLLKLCRHYGDEMAYRINAVLTI